MLGILPSGCLRTPFQTVSWRTSQNPHSTQYGAYCRQQQAHVQEGGSMPTRDKRLLTDLRCRKHDHPLKAEIWQRLHYVAHSNEISVKQPQRAHWTTLSARSAARRPRNPKGPALPALSYTYISPDATQASLHKKSKSCIAPPRSARTAEEGMPYRRVLCFLCTELAGSRP